MKFRSTNPTTIPIVFLFVVGILACCGADEGCGIRVDSRETAPEIAPEAELAEKGIPIPLEPSEATTPPEIAPEVIAEAVKKALSPTEKRIADRREVDKAFAEEVRALPTVQTLEIVYKGSTYRADLRFFTDDRNRFVTVTHWTYLAGDPVDSAKTVWVSRADKFHVAGLKVDGKRFPLVNLTAMRELSQRPPTVLREGDSWWAAAISEVPDSETTAVTVDIIVNRAFAFTQGSATTYVQELANTLAFTVRGDEDMWGNLKD